MKQFPLLSNSRGSALIGAMIAIALLSALMTQVMTINSNKTDQNNRQHAMTEAEELTRYIQDIMSQPNLCLPPSMASAGGQQIQMFGVGGGPVIWDGTGEGAIGSIVAVGKTVASVGQTYGGLFSISKMYLRAPNGTEGTLVGQGKAALVPPGGGPAIYYTTLTAKLTINYDFAGTLQAQGFAGVFGGDTYPRAADIVVAFNPANHNVDYCYEIAQNKMFSTQCFVAADVSQGESPCTGLAIPPGCYPLYTYTGFDGLANPRCRCTIACDRVNQGDKGDNGADVPAYFYNVTHVRI